MTKAVNIEHCFSNFSDTFSPKIVAELNGQYVLLVRCEGDQVPWHVHEGQDEMFFVFDGILEVHEKERSVNLHPGDSISCREAWSIGWSPEGMSSSCCLSRRISPTPET